MSNITLPCPYCSTFGHHACPSHAKTRGESDLKIAQDTLVAAHDALAAERALRIAAEAALAKAKGREGRLVAALLGLTTQAEQTTCGGDGGCGCVWGDADDCGCDTSEKPHGCEVCAAINTRIAAARAALVEVDDG